jgi:hemin uptake protein HemP
MNAGEVQQTGNGRVGAEAAGGRLPGAFVIDSFVLLAGRKEVQIRHGQEVYRLRVTRNGKLILNK